MLVDDIMILGFLLLCIYIEYFLKKSNIYIHTHIYKSLQLTEIPCEQEKYIGLTENNYFTIVRNSLLIMCLKLKS